MSDFELENVLLVEDDEVDVRTVQRAFRAKNLPMKLWVRRDGIEALELLRSGELSPHGLLVLMDLNMPRMGGLELLAELRKDPELHRIAVVVLTTSDDQSDRLRAYDANVAGYIIKPVTFDKFADVVGKVAGYWSLMEMP